MTSEKNLKPEVTLAAVVATIGRVVGEGRIPTDSGPDLALANGGLWLGSLELVEIIVACEESFGIFLDPEVDLTPQTLRTVGHLTAALQAVRTRTYEKV